MTTPGGSDDQGWGQQGPGRSPDAGNPYGQQPRGGNPYSGGQPTYGQQPYGGGQPHGQQPPYGQQQPSYGYGGMAPMPGGTPPPPVARPSEVGTAFWLWVASMVVSLVGSIVAFATLGDEVRTQLETQVRDDPTLNQSDLETIIRISLVVGVAFGLLFVALQLFFVFKMRSGRNWARIVLTVLGALSVLLTVVGLQSAELADAGFGLVQAILIVAAIVFMFTGGAREYFAPRPKY